MLRWLKRPDEAESVLSVAVLRFPENEEVLVQRVLVACDLGRWEEAEARAAALLARLPTSPASYRYAAEVDARRERFVEAELMLAEGMQALGSAPVLTLPFAELAARRKDWKAAARRWAIVVRQLPAHEAAHRGLAQALRQLGRPDEAECVLAAACERFPASMPLATDRAWATGACGDWPASIRQWRMLAERDPNNATIRQGLETALEQAGLPPQDIDRVPPPEADAAASVLADPAKLILCFESLGANCELGLVQRNAGVEPLGLLRFAGITLDRLLTALDGDFAGVGDPAFTHVYLRDGVEYMISDTRYGLHMHSFTGPNQIALEQFAHGTSRRLRFLARKLREDLREAGKIFVRTGADDEETRERIMQLHGALRRHGANTLLFVETTGDPGRVGRAEWLAPGVMLGWIEGFSVTTVRHDQWRAVCRAAYVLWTAERAGGGTPVAVAPAITASRKAANADGSTSNSG